MALELRHGGRRGKIRLNRYLRRVVDRIGPICETLMRILTIILIAALVGSAVGGSVGYFEATSDVIAAADAPRQPDEMGRRPLLRGFVGCDSVKWKKCELAHGAPWPWCLILHGGSPMTTRA